MWTEERATFHGKYFRVENAILEPKPSQKPHPPILIGGAGEQTGQQQAVALAARERAHRLARLLLAEQELLEIAHDVAPLAQHLDPVAAGGAQDLPGRLVGVELGAVLVEACDGEVGAEPHRAGVGLDLAGEQLEQRRLAGTVGADDRGDAPRRELERERIVGDQGAEPLGDRFQAQRHRQPSVRISQAGL